MAHAGRIAVVAAAAVAALTAAAVAPSVVSASGESDPVPSTRYYLSLGDSLAAGYQPDTRDDEPVAYTDQLYESLRADEPELEHVRLGCSGETTDSMIDGAGASRLVPCDYSDQDASSQLDAAVAFLEDHLDQVEVVTLDIGANDLNGCMFAGVDLDCLADAVTRAEGNLATIMSRLREAGGADVQYAVMTYYDPYLAGERGGVPELVASASRPVLDDVNTRIRAVADDHGFLTADVADAFATGDSTPATLPDGETGPREVALICAWTWMCTEKHDIHANREGHAQIARTFAQVLTGTPADPNDDSAAIASAAPPAPSDTHTPAPTTTPPTPPTEAAPDQANGGGAAAGTGATAPTPRSESRTAIRLLRPQRQRQRGWRALMAVRISTSPGARPSGRVVIRDRRQRLRVVLIDASGARTVRLPRLAPDARHRLSARYVGTPRARPSRSNSIVLAPR